MLIYEINSEGGKTKVTKKGTTIPSHDELHQVEFTPDGKRAFSNSYGGVALVGRNKLDDLQRLGGLPRPVVAGWDPSRAGESGRPVAH
jgi:hypothetical protein